MSRVRMESGRIKMSGGRYAATCGGCPAYAASDGSYETDDFSGTMDWNESAGDTFANSGGKLQQDTGDVDADAHKTFSVTDETDLLIIAEVDVHDLNAVNIGLQIWVDASTSNRASIFSSPGVGWGASYTDGTENDSDFTAGTPQNGDKLTIAIRKKATGFQVCYYKNEVILWDPDYDFTDDWDFEIGTNRYVLAINNDETSAPYGEWDDFTIQIDE